MTEPPPLHQIGAGAVLIAAVAMLGLVAPLLAPGEPLDIAGPPLVPPFVDAHLPLGTDALGRSLLAGLAYGARTTLLVAGTAAACSLGLGIVVGATAGFFGGALDALLMRLTEAFQTVPAFLLALALVSVLGPRLSTIVLAIALAAWTGTARVVRAEFLSLKARDFVAAYRLMGMRRLEIAFVQILPNALAPIGALAAIVVANAILIEAALAFLGLSDPNRASWGGMIANGRAVLRTAWYVAAVPGAAIALTVVAVGLMGDGLGAAGLARRERGG